MPRHGAGSQPIARSTLHRSKARTGCRSHQPQPARRQVSPARLQGQRERACGWCARAAGCRNGPRSSTDHVKGGPWVKECSALGQRNHRHGAAAASGARGGAVQRVHRDVHARQAAACETQTLASHACGKRCKASGARLPSPMRSPQYSMGALSFSPAHMRMFSAAVESGALRRQMESAAAMRCRPTFSDDHDAVKRDAAQHLCSAARAVRRG
jgi:hypothetical protein